jgi:hypothetical protein
VSFTSGAATTLEGLTIFDSSFLVVTEAFNCTGADFAAALDKLLLVDVLAVLTAEAPAALDTLALPPRLSAALAVALTAAGLAFARAAAPAAGVRLTAFTPVVLAGTVFACCPSFAAFTAAGPTAALDTAFAATLATTFAAVLTGALPTAGLAPDLPVALDTLDTFLSVFAGFFISTRHRINAKSYSYSLRTI